MKNIFILIFLTISWNNLYGQCTNANTTVINNGLNISFDQINGRVIIDGIDPCRYSETELETIACHRACNKRKNEILDDCYNSSWWEDCKSD